MLVESRSGKKEYRAFSDETGNETGTLPSKLKPWYNYAYQFVEAIKKKQPKLVVVVKKQVTLPKSATNPSQVVNMKISSVYSLSGHIEATMKHQTDSNGPTETVIVKASPPKYDFYELEQNVRGLK